MLACCQNFPPKQRLKQVSVKESWSAGLCAFATLRPAGPVDAAEAQEGAQLLSVAHQRDVRDVVLAALEQGLVDPSFSCAPRPSKCRQCGRNDASLLRGVCVCVSVLSRDVILERLAEALHAQHALLGHGMPQLGKPWLRGAGLRTCRERAGTPHSSQSIQRGHLFVHLKVDLTDVGEKAQQHGVGSRQRGPKVKCICCFRLGRQQEQSQACDTLGSHCLRPC